MSPMILIILFLFIANIPWFTERVFLVIPLNKAKSAFIRLVELIVFYFASLLIAAASEIQFSGDIFPQQWEFFVTTFCLFLVLSVPGVVYRYQWLPIQKKLS
jgi:hypothetical protein